MAEEWDVEAGLKKLQITISNPYLVEPLTITGIDRIIEFFKKEKAFWDQPKRSEQFVDGHRNNLHDDITALENFKRTAQNHSPEDFAVQWKKHTDGILRKWQVRTRMFSATPEARFLLEIFNESPQQANVAFLVITGDQNANLQIRNRDDLFGYLKAYEFISPDSELVSRGRNEVKVLGDLEHQWQQTTENLKNEFQDTTELLTTWRDEFVDDNQNWQTEHKAGLEEWREQKQQQLDQLINESNDRVKSLENLYREKLRLEAPVKYWADMAEKYRRLGYQWTIGLCAATILFIGVLLAILYNLPAVFNIKVFTGDPQAIRAILILVAVLSLGAYMAKTLNKLAFSSFHLQRDAEERKQLTMVYLALSAEEGNVTESDRTLILQSIFSRADTGLIGKDSAPSMPGLIGALEKIVKKP